MQGSVHSGQDSTDAGAIVIVEADHAVIAGPLLDLVVAILASYDGLAC